MVEYKISHTEENVRISARVDPLLKKLIIMIANKEVEGNASKIIEDALWKAIKRRGFNIGSITTTRKRDKKGERIDQVLSLVEGPKGYKLPDKD